MDCMPVAKGNSLRKSITSALMSPCKASIISATKPTKFGSVEHAGCSQLAFDAQLLLESTPSFVTISINIKNAFNKVKRTTIL